ncbi:hypothetical protein [Microvirga massiliensis]|uniref:hypothetical protein n=1 Tax=Microvirga massiliensis TaxID=1033741 RepID=UPI00066070E7|nr:hypothetical protein [Microvirga massiliensis]
MPRLWCKPPAFDKKTGKLRERAAWVIVDGKEWTVTGVTLSEGESHKTAIAPPEAKKRLADYIADKHEPNRIRNSLIDDVLVTEVLEVYLDEVVPDLARPKKAAERVVQLSQWWQGKTLAQVTGKRCCEYLA